jgi:uncharacterized membrane protein
VQSVIVFGGLQIVQLLISSVLTPIMWRSLALIGFFGFINTILWISEQTLWVPLMVKAYNGQMYKLPFVGDLAEKYSA